MIKKIIIPHFDNTYKYGGLYGADNILSFIDG